MRPGWEIWALRRLVEQERCLMEPGMCCIPLRGDTICRCCYEDVSAREEQERIKNGEIEE